MKTKKIRKEMEVYTDCTAEEAVEVIKMLCDKYDDAVQVEVQQDGTYWISTEKFLDCDEWENITFNKMDINTAGWLADKMVNDTNVFPVEFEECEKCGAMYIKELGHDCDKTIMMPWHVVNNDNTR